MLVLMMECLGTISDNKLSFDYSLRKQAKLSADRSLMTLFHTSLMVSIFTFSSICWHASLKLKQENALTKVIKEALNRIVCLIYIT